MVDLACETAIHLGTKIISELKKNFFAVRREFQRDAQKYRLFLF